MPDELKSSMRTEHALLRLLKKLQSIEASRDRRVIAESVVIAALEILQAHAALLLGVKATQKGHLTAPIAWVLADGQSATTRQDHIEFENVQLAASPLIEESLSTLEGFSTLDLGERVILAFAIQSQGTSVAVVEAECDSLPSEALRNCVIELLGIYAEHLGLLDYAELDTLTRLHNRKTFDENFDRFIEIAEQSQRRDTADGLATEAVPSECWLGVADIDKFKRINDNFGHLFGDEVLLRIAELMKKSFRGSDKLFRFGGEEFVVLLRYVSAEDAEHVFSRFIQAVEHHEFPQVGQVTCSIGYVRIDPSLTPAEILGRADEALYFSKQNGRNQVNRYETLLEKGFIEGPAAPTANEELQADIDALFD